MSTILEQAHAFMERVKDMARDDVREALKLIPDEVKSTYYKLRKNAYFVPENAGTPKELISPSGKYKLVVTPYQTSPGAWGYTQGLVYAIGSDTPIAAIRRNYSSFPHLFIEGHPNGHDYLIGGEDYQGQTVIELDTGRRRDFLPEAAKQGHGFCWAQMRFDTSSKLLVVDGCIWACPYEYRFYDFSDPMEGWPEIESEACIDVWERWPEINADGTIVCFQLELPEDSDDDDDDDDDEEEIPPEKRPVAATTTYRREDFKLVLIAEDVTEKERLRRERRAEGERKWQQWKADFRANDPLYLTYAALVKDPVFTPDEYESTGVTYDGWCPDAKYDETRWCRRIASRKDHKGEGYTIDLEWGVKTAPVKLGIYKGGNKSEDKFFEHSTEGMSAAFAYAKALLLGDTSS